MLSFHAELVLIEIRIDKGHVENAVGNEINLFGWDIVNLLQHLGASLAHDDETGGKYGEFLQDAALIGAGALQNGVERCDDWNSQIAQKCEDEAAGRTTEDAILMLQTNDVSVAEVQVIGRAPVRIEVVFSELKAHLAGIFVALRQIVDRGDEAFRFGKLLGHGLAQIIGESRNTAFPREVIANKGDFLDIGNGRHELDGMGNALEGLLHAVGARGLQLSPPKFYSRFETRTIATLLVSSIYRQSTTLIRESIEAIISR